MNNATNMVVDFLPFCRDASQLIRASFHIEKTIYFFFKNLIRLKALKLIYISMIYYDIVI
jgi:hypothetical protein